MSACCESLVAAFLPSCQLGAIPAMRIALGVARSLACLSLAARPRSHLAAMSGAARPELCVFDLDACLWDKEMFQMSDVPEPSDVVQRHVNITPCTAGRQHHTCYAAQRCVGRARSWATPRLTWGHVGAWGKPSGAA